MTPFKGKFKYFFFLLYWTVSHYKIKSLFQLSITATPLLCPDFNFQVSNMIEIINLVLISLSILHNKAQNVDCFLLLFDCWRGKSIFMSLNMSGGDL